MNFMVIINLTDSILIAMVAVQNIIDNLIVNNDTPYIDPKYIDNEHVVSICTSYKITEYFMDILDDKTRSTRYNAYNSIIVTPQLTHDTNNTLCFFYFFIKKVRMSICQTVGVGCEF